MGDDGELDAVLGQITQGLVRDHPEWVRAVLWIGRLAEKDGSLAPENIRLNRVLTWSNKDDEVHAEYGRTGPLFDPIEELYRLVDDVRWTQIRLVEDRDGQRSFTLITDEPARQEEGSATDPYWQQVHDYLELNRDEVDALVERLHSSGDLPGGKKKPSRGVLGYFRPGT